MRTRGSFAIELDEAEETSKDSKDEEVAIEEED